MIGDTMMWGVSKDEDGVYHYKPVIVVKVENIPLENHIRCELYFDAYGRLHGIEVMYQWISAEDLNEDSN